MAETDSLVVRVWVRETTIADATDLTSADTVLSEPERRRRDRFAFVEDQRDYALAHELLRRSLAGVLDRAPQDLQFETDASGRSRLVYPQVAISCSLSHARGVVACALWTEGDVGVDVERVDANIDVETIAKRHYSAREHAALASCTNELRIRRFIELWTLKEAFLKATGRGLSGSLDAISFAFTNERTIDVEPPPGDGARSWMFALYRPFPGTRLAVAAHGVRVPAASCIALLSTGEEASIASFRSTPPANV